VALGGVAGLRRTLGPQIFCLLLLTPRPGWYNDAVVGPFASPAHSVDAASGATLVKLICAVMATGLSVPKPAMTAYELTDERERRLRSVASGWR
jgi:hypothetical protein